MGMKYLVTLRKRKHLRLLRPYLVGGGLNKSQRIQEYQHNPKPLGSHSNPFELRVGNIPGLHHEYKSILQKESDALWPTWILPMYSLLCYFLESHGNLIQ